VDRRLIDKIQVYLALLLYSIAILGLIILITVPITKRIIRDEIRTEAEKKPLPDIMVFKNSGFVKGDGFTASYQRFGKDGEYWVKVVTEHGTAELAVDNQKEAVELLGRITR